MRTKAIQWLYEELPGLVSAGVLDAASADRLRRHYDPEDAQHVGVNPLLLIFGVLGALLIGGGIALLLAHNWQELDRPVRVGIAFGLLVVAQALVAWVIGTRRESRPWSEGSALFLTLVVVSVIALISQTYHMSGELEHLLLTWILLVIPLVYLLSSTSVAGVVWIGAAWWLLAGPWWDDSSLRLGTYLLLSASTAPFLLQLWRKHRERGSTALLGWVIGVAFLLAGVRAVTPHGGHIWIPFYAGILGAFYVAGIWMRMQVDGAWRQPFHQLGVLGLGLLVFTMGFIEMWREGESLRVERLETLIILLILGLALTTFATCGGIRFWRRGRTHQALVAWLPAAAIAAWLLNFIPESPAIPTLAANLTGLGVGLAVCVFGVREGRLGTANGGLILVLAMLTGRFFDAELSFVIRGIGFILLGVILLSVNVLILRRQGGGGR